VTKTYTDNAAPYALHGDNGAGDYYASIWSPPATGAYTLEATPYSGANASGTAGTPLTISFTIVEQIAQVSSFTLIDAEADKDIRAVVNGEEINLAQLPSRRLSIRVNTSPATVGSVKMVLRHNGQVTKTYTDNAAPYALHGDNGAGDYYASIWSPPATGAYTLEATPYSGANASGTAGTPLTISFTIVDYKLTTTQQLSFSRSEVISFNVYPNPSMDGKVNIQLLGGEIKGNVYYSLINSIGQRVVEGEERLDEPNTLLQFDFSAKMKAPGIYYLRIRSINLDKSVRLVRY
jgi:hypothetical protein